MSPHKLYRQLRLARAVQATQHVDLMSTVWFVSGPEGLLQLLCFGQLLHKLVHSRHGPRLNVT